jgi:hypothetical protein
MAADSACSMTTMIDLKNLMAGNFQEAFKNVLSGDVMRNGNAVGSKIVSRTVPKLHVMKGDNIAISSGHEYITRNTGISIWPHLENFCIKNHFDNPKSAAEALLKYIQGIDPTMGAKYHVCGYNHEGEIPMPEFWYVNVAENQITPVAINGAGGISFSGANDYFSPYVPMVNANMIHYTLQDAIDLTVFAIEMSMKLEKFIKLEEHISPPVDVLVITQSGIEWVSKKKLEV